MRFFDKVSTQLMSPSRTVLWLFDISCRKSTCEPIVTQTRALEVLLSIMQHLKSLISCILSNIASSFKAFLRDRLNHFFSQTPDNVRRKWEPVHRPWGTSPSCLSPFMVLLVGSQKAQLLAGLSVGSTEWSAAAAPGEMCYTGGNSWGLISCLGPSSAI